MATQGILSVQRGSTVLMKFIAGSDGYNVTYLANDVRRFIEDKGRLPTRGEAYELAVKAKLGDEASLVVMDEEGWEFRGGDEIHPRYRETFQRPRFNPRWEWGTADYVRVIRL